MTAVTLKAMNLLTERGMTVRNQAVLQRGVNDNVETMQLLIKRLGYMNVTPYYVFFHDLVQGVEDLRTTLSSGLDLEKRVRGITAGFNTPTFIVDTFGGGGKRDAHSFEHYDPETGIAVYVSPTVRPGRHYFYFDPIDTLAEDVQARWRDPGSRREIMENALREAGAFD
jgi:lysine 2,3-aminomutase